jgi:tRNA-Thr(GGU) m(6)t(6)A37 methyltransferase TsaA
MLKGHSIMKIQYKSIGIIHSPFKVPKGTPIQAASGKSKGTVEVYPEYTTGLKDLEGFSDIILIYHFHMSKNFSLQVKPYLDEQTRGLFATRAPSRPNPIGISIVKLIRIVGSKLYIQNLDIIDDTPLLDIKPYVPEFDCPQEYKIGWLEKHIHNMFNIKDDNRFNKDK